MSTGLWYARSSEFLYTPALTVLRWLRTPGEIVFALGALSIGVFMVGLLAGWSLKGGRHDVTPLSRDQRDEVAARVDGE